ncbi:MAG: hypothetical protein ACRDNY_12170 [Gaiellaceae bacterium]
MFDLQDSIVDEAEVGELEEAAAAEPNVYRTQTFEPETFEPETFETGTFEPEPMEQPDEVFGEPGPGESRRPRWVNWIIPLALLVYFAISFLVNER